MILRIVSMVTKSDSSHCMIILVISAVRTSVVSGKENKTLPALVLVLDLVPFATTMVSSWCIVVMCS